MNSDDEVRILKDKFREADAALRGVADVVRGARSAEEHFANGQRELSTAGKSVESAADALTRISGQLSILLQSFSEAVTELRKADSESLRRDVARLLEQIAAVNDELRSKRLVAGIESSLVSVEATIASIKSRVDDDRPLNHLTEICGRTATVEQASKNQTKTETSLADIGTSITTLVDSIGEFRADMEDRCNAVDAAGANLRFWIRIAAGASLVAVALAASHLIMNLAR